VEGSDRVRLEIAFDGQQFLTVTVPTMTADDLDRALGEGGDSSISFESDEGRYTVSTRRIVYVKRSARETRVGFGSTTQG
jgi:hypothetical protein